MTEKKPKAAPAKPQPKPKPKATLRKAGTTAKQGLEQGIEQARRTRRDVIAATRVKGEAVFADAREKGEAAIKTARKRGEAMIADALEKGEAAISTARKKGSVVLSTAREKGEAAIEDTREKTARAAAETNRLFLEHPITAVAAAVAAGAVFGIFLPRFNVTSKAGKLAGRAIKAAAANEAAQRVWSSVRDARKPEDETGTD
jgi:ElaB/YqjD/DUF883 family membrane-anchored ribosome-binding protein